MDKIQKIKYLVKLLTTVCILFLVSCAENESNHSKYEPSVELVRKGSLVIPLDSVTPPFATSFQYYHDGTDGYFSFMNRFNNSIYHFNIDKNEYARIDSFPIEGPNGVGRFKNTTQFVLHSDSTFLYDRGSKRLIILDNLNNVVFKHSFGLKAPLTPYGMRGDWLIFDKHRLDFSSSTISFGYSIIEELPDSLELTLDIRSGKEKRVHLPLPNKYAGKMWRSEHLSYYRVLDASRKRRVYSFPIDDEVLIKDEFGMIYSKSLGVSFIDEIEPMENLNMASDMQRMNKNLFGQGMYGKMYYDPFRDIYLRLATSGIREDKLGFNRPYEDTTAFSKTLILGNGNLEKIGELNGHSLNHSVIFFRPDGIYILKVSDEEDYMIFDIYDLKEL